MTRQAGAGWPITGLHGAIGPRWQAPGSRASPSDAALRDRASIRPMATRKEILEVGGHEVTVTNPDKVYFPRAGHTKLDVVRFFLAVADGALTGVRGRPMALKRFVDGIEREPFFQKRAPDNRPDWM